KFVRVRKLYTLHLKLTLESRVLGRECNRVKNDGIRSLQDELGFKMFLENEKHTKDPFAS
ncbi:CLUMA_CG016587, isoform A, partial [Clunio marinus]